MRMVQGGEELGFALEAREPLGVISDDGEPHLDRDIVVQPRIARAIDPPAPSNDTTSQASMRTPGDRETAS
jgi:hypothetical protein